MTKTQNVLVVCFLALFVGLMAFMAIFPPTAVTIPIVGAGMLVEFVLGFYLIAGWS